MNQVVRVALVTVMCLLCAGVTVAQEEDSGKKKRSGLRRGAVTGAGLGLALGALTGDAEIALKGAAAGAATGAATGSWYDYDASRQDDRTEMLATAIAGSNTSGAAPAPNETVGDVGKRHFEDFKGEWKLDIGYVGQGGEWKSAAGSARGLSVGENSIRVLLQNITSEGYDEVVNGYTLLKYEPGQGFFLESSFSILDELLNGVGEYKVDQNAYDFYMVDPTSGEMMTGGLMRSNVRVVISIVSPTKWTAEAFTMVDGKEMKAQSYTFTRP
jgi:hypothetical protein